MKLYRYRKAILSALHEARTAGPNASRAEDAAALLSVRNAAQSLRRPEKGTEAYRKKLLANLSNALAKANVLLLETQGSVAAMHALQAVVPIEKRGEPLEADLRTLADGLQAFAEVSGGAANLQIRRTTIEVLMEFFSLAYKIHTGAVPTVRKYDGGHEHSGKAYGPYLNYICAVGAALGIACTPEGVATAFNRLDEPGKLWVRQPFVPLEQQFRAYLEKSDITD